MLPQLRCTERERERGAWPHTPNPVGSSAHSPYFSALFCSQTRVAIMSSGADWQPRASMALEAAARELEALREAFLDDPSKGLSSSRVDQLQARVDEAGRQLIQAPTLVMAFERTPLEETLRCGAAVGSPGKLQLVG